MSYASHSSRAAASTARWSYSPSSIRRQGIRSPTCCLNSFRPNGQWGRSSIRARSRPDSHLFRNVMVGGVHVHHQVFGILIMFASGLTLIATTSDGAALDIVAACFGVGSGLTFDEFALWLHLRDVYWSTEGRKSV